MRIYLAIVLVCFSVFPLHAQDSEKGFSALARVPLVSLEDLSKSPDKHLGLRIKLTLSCNQEIDPGNPYFTRFLAAQYARFSVRSGAGALWEPAIAGREFQHLFVAKDSPLLATLRSAKANQRFEATAIVRDNFRNIPWLEVVDLKLKPEWVPEGTLIAVARGKKLREEGQRHLALEQFQKALVEPLPSQEKVSLLKEMAALHGELEEAAKARQLLEQALALAPQDTALQEALKN